MAALALVSAGCGSSKSTSSDGARTATASAPATNSAAAQTSGDSGFGLTPDPSVEALVPASATTKGVLNDGIYNDGAPEMYLDSGKLIGIQVDLAEAVSEVMGVKFTTVPIGDFSTLIPGLQGGRFDVAFADFGVTAAREKVVDFVSEFTLGTAFGVKTGSSIKINAGTDLCGLSVGVLAGSYFVTQVQTLSQSCVSGGKKPIGIQSFPTASAAILAVSNSRVEVFSETADELGYAATQPAADLDAQPYIYAPVVQGVGLPKDSPFDQPILAAMKVLVTNGTYAKILSKWHISSAALPVAQIVLNAPAS